MVLWGRAAGLSRPQRFLQSAISTLMASEGSPSHPLTLRARSLPHASIFICEGFFIRSSSYEGLKLPILATPRTVVPSSRSMLPWLNVQPTAKSASTSPNPSLSLQPSAMSLPS